jgi:hypothetical protein
MNLSIQAHHSLSWLRNSQWSRIKYASLTGILKMQNSNTANKAWQRLQDRMWRRRPSPDALWRCDGVRRPLWYRHQRRISLLWYDEGDVEDFSSNLWVTRHQIDQTLPSMRMRALPATQSSADAACGPVYQSSAPKQTTRRRFEFKTSKTYI